MNKLAIHETFPPGIVGREIVLAQMCHHYRRISTAKARVDTNLFKPPKPSLSRPLSAEVASIVQRSLTPRSPPKHRRCLKYEHELGEFQFKPTTRSQGVESRLRSTPEIYHPAVRSPKTSQNEHEEANQQATQTSFENSLTEELPKTRDEGVQTVNANLYRPIDLRSVQFLRDITNEALQQRAFTSAALNRIFLEHQYKNAYSLTQELMDRELEELRRQLGMLPRHHPFPGTVSDSEALDALDSLVLDPQIKEQVIQSLRLSRDNDVRKKKTFQYFDRLKGDEDELELPIREAPSMDINAIARQLDLTEHIASQVLTSKKGSVDVAGKIIDPTNNGQGWDAEVDEEDRPITTDSSSEDERQLSTSLSNDEEAVESMSDPDDEGQQSDSYLEEVASTSDDEIEEVTQIESTSKQQLTEGRSEFSGITEHGMDDTDHEDSSSEIEKSEAATKSRVSIRRDSDRNDENHSQLQLLKVEPLTQKGDKWRASLEAVKEESDSTAGQISELLTASSSSEDEEKSPSQLPVALSGQNISSSGTYHSAESIQKTNGAMEASSSVQQESTSSTGREIVLEMADLLLKNDKRPSLAGEDIQKDAEKPEETGPRMDAGEELSESVEEVEEEVATENESVDEDEEKTNSGSEVESIHTESDDDDPTNNATSAE